MYQYQNDCLTAGIEYNKEYYSDQDLKPSEICFQNFNFTFWWF